MRDEPRKNECAYRDRTGYCFRQTLSGYQYCDKHVKIIMLKMAKPTLVKKHQPDKQDKQEVYDSTDQEG